MTPPGRNSKMYFGGAGDGRERASLRRANFWSLCELFHTRMDSMRSTLDAGQRVQC